MIRFPCTRTACKSILLVLVISIVTSSAVWAQPRRRPPHRPYRSPKADVHIGLFPPFGPDFPPKPLLEPNKSRASYHVVDVDQVPPDFLSSQAFRRRAETALRDKHYGQAVRMLSHALIENPKEGRLHLLLSHALLAAGDYPGAARSLEQGLQLAHPGDWGFVVRQNHKYFAPREYDRVLAAQDVYMRVNASGAGEHLVRGYHYLFRGQNGQARQSLQTAIELDAKLTIANRLLKLTAEPAPAAVPVPVETLPPPPPPEPAPAPTQ